MAYIGTTCAVTPARLSGHLHILPLPTSLWPISLWPIRYGQPCAINRQQGSQSVQDCGAHGGYRAQGRRAAGPIPFMACVVLACIFMAYVVMACIVMAHTVHGCVVMAYIVMAYALVAHVFM